MRGPHRYREQAIRSDLVPYFETVLPVAQHNGPSVCHDCEFTLSLGMVWGYRWSTLSGHVTTPVSSMNLDNTPDYGFRLLHQATPRWRYVLALDHQQNTLDVVGEALWRIRPDVYIRLTADLYDFDLLTLPLSDLRLNFSGTPPIRYFSHHRAAILGNPTM